MPLEPTIEYDRDLHECAIPELNALALQHGVELFGDRHKDAIVERLEGVGKLGNQGA